MGWKTFFQMTQEQFKSKYDKGEKWGDLPPVLIRVTNATVEDIYGAGIITTSPVGPAYSAKIQHFVGAKTRLTCSYIAGFKAGATGRIGIYIGFYKNTEWSKDPQGYGLFGILHPLATAQQYDVFEKHEFKVETENTKIVLYLNNEKFAEYTLEAPLQSFVYALHVPEVSGNTAFIAIYEVKAEYYDVFEDLINTMMNMMWIMMIVMLVIMFVSAFVRGFRVRRRERREGEVK